MNTEYAVISPSNPEYPEVIRSILPSTQLYATGNLDLLGKRAIGICGSREASPEAQDYAFKFGREAANKGFVVVSGYARGVDRQAHRGALEAGGATIAVLPEGINYFRLVRELKPLVDLGRNFLAISMFDPDAVWKSWQAMERNKLIVALSMSLFVVEARARGGTINAAMECVRQKKSLWAIAYSKELAGREGNRKLLQTSAIPLKRQSDLRKALEESASKPVEEVSQLALNLL